MPAISQNELKDQVWKQEPLFEGHKTKNYVVRSNDSAGVGAFPGIPRVDLMLRGKAKTRRYYECLHPSRRLTFRLGTKFEG